MIDFALRHAGTARPGGHCTIKGGFYTYDPPRGHAAVSHDSSVWFYRVSRGERREFRQWLAGTFGGMNLRLISGRWPHYDVKG